MSEKIMKKSRVLIAALLGTVMIAALTIWGCGTSSYDDPAAGANITTTKTANALIDVATLKGWMDEGKVNAPFTSYDRVVILTVSPAADATTTTTTNTIDNNGTTADATDDKYITTVKAVTTYGYSSHIPGAQLWNSGSELGFTRREGVADMTTMVPDGASMDTLIQRFGINKYTTVVLTVSKGQNNLNAARAYFTLRYWGFPKERLKVLDGGDDAWVDSGKALTTTVPTIAKSTYSVRNNYTGNYTSFGLRFSIGEMINLVDKVNAATESTTDVNGISILDARGGADYNTAHITGSIYDDHAAYTVAATGTSTSPGTVTTITTTPFATGVAAVAAPVTVPNPKTRIYKADLAGYLTGINVPATKKMNYVYCVSGYRASVPFFVLDGVLNRSVKLYDGSWGQWSGYRLANLPDVSGAASMWRVDNNSRSSFAVTPATVPITFTTTTGALTGALPISDNLYLGFTSVLDPEANQILKADKIYFSTPPVSTTTSGGASGGGSGC